jgi:hypothetical protein
MIASGMQRDFSRQARAFPHERRRLTCIAELGASSACRLASTFLKAGAAAAGIPGIWSNYAGPQAPGVNWLLGSHTTLIKTVGGNDVVLDYIDPLNIADDLTALVQRYHFPLIVLHLHDPAAAYETASQLAHGGIEAPLLLTFDGPSGVLVERTTPSEAVRRLESLRCGPQRAAGPCAELAMLGAGSALSEIMLGDPLTQLSRIALFYSIQRRRRIDCQPQTPLVDLVAELSTPIERATFCGRRGVQIGVGGLGNGTAIAVSLDHEGPRATPSAVSKSLRLLDGDAHIAPSNGNRQILFCGHIGEGPKAPIATDVLRQIDPQGNYEGWFRAVKSRSDLDGPDFDYLLIMPDNNEARLLGGDVAWEGGRLMATAATSATAGYAVVQEPGRGCFRCVAGLDDSSSGAAARESCGAVEDDAIVATNLVCGALAVSELREALSGRPATNMSFHGTNHSGNCLMRKISDPPCPHRAQAGCCKTAAITG